MTLVSGPLSTVTTTPSAVSQVNISINSPRTRGAGVMTPEVKTVTVTGGAFSSQIAPGPAVLTLLIGGRESAPIPILVGDVASQTLAEVVEAARLATGYSAENLAQFVQQVLGARHDVLGAVEEFEQLEGDVLTAMGETVTSASNAASAATTAVQAASSADLRATSAESSAGNAVSRVAALETMAGLAPGDVSDATVTNLLHNPTTNFSGAIKASQVDTAWETISERQSMTMVSVDEVAMENTEPQVTPTYDNTGQSVHPDVVRIPGGFGPQGFEWWMGMTPYPDGNGATENPSVIASHDGENWVVPDGLTNPIAAPATGFWPDPDLYFDHSIRRLYLVWLGMRISWSDDGVQWTDPVLLTPSLTGEVSPALVMESPGIFSMWSCQRVDGQINKILRRQATSLEDPDSGWSVPPTECVFTPPPGLEPWHIDVQKVGHGYWALLSCCLEGTSGGSAELFFATSPDGIRWQISEKPVLSGRRGEWDDTNIYRATMIPSDGRGDVLADVWYSARSATGQWRIARTKLTRKSLVLQSEVAKLAPLAVPAEHTDTVRIGVKTRNLFPGDSTLMTPAGLVPVGWLNYISGATNHGWDQSREAYRITEASGSLVYGQKIPATPGQWYTFSADFASPDSGRAQVGMVFFDTSGTQISGSSGAQIVGASDFKRMSVTLRAPENTASMQVNIAPRHKDPVATGYYRRVQLEMGQAPTPWTSGVANEVQLDGVHDAQQVMVSRTDIRWRINQQGLPVLPRFADDARPSASESGAGAMIWNATSGKVEVSAGSDWQRVGASAGSSGGNLITFNPSLMIPKSDGLVPDGWGNNLIGAVDHGWDLVQGAYTVRAKGDNMRLLTPLPVSGSHWYTFSVDFASPDSGRARLGISWKNSSGGTISGSTSTYLVVASNFERMSYTVQAPENARSAEVNIQPGSSADELKKFFIRNAIFEEGTEASFWHSGAEIRLPEILKSARVLEASDSDLILDFTTGNVLLPAPAEEGQLHKLKNVTEIPITVASRDSSVTIDGAPNLAIPAGGAIALMMHSGRWVSMA